MGLEQRLDRKKTLLELREERVRMQKETGLDVPYTLLGIAGGVLAFGASAGIGVILSYVHNNPSYADNGSCFGIYVGSLLSLGGMLAELGRSD